MPRMRKLTFILAAMLAVTSSLAAQTVRAPEIAFTTDAKFDARAVPAYEGRHDDVGEPADGVLREGHVPRRRQPAEAAREEKDEQDGLFYVALSRARDRLFI